MAHMNILILICKWSILAYTVSSLIPLLNSNYWWVRLWDFPRLQLLVLGALCGLIYATKSQNSLGEKMIFLGVLLIGLGVDVYRIAPYSPLWPPESLSTENKKNDPSISFLTANVLQENKNSEKLLSLIREKSPHIVLLLEVNERWLRDLKVLDETYQYSIKQPLENEYGIALYSRLPLEDAKVKFLVESDVPSIEVSAIMKSGDKIKIFGLHPKPPRPQDRSSTNRDAELVIVAKTVRKITGPVVVLGDLNDVAWSHTTRLFSRISKLLDPRIGRGPLATFPAAFPFLRFPLDHIFHSNELRLVAIERLDRTGSDHLPIFVSFNWEPEKAHEQPEPTLNKGDLSEAQETIHKSKD